MKKQVVQVVSLAVILSFVAGCAFSRISVLDSTVSYYEKSYDEVWKAVSDFLLNDMNCSIESEDKGSGRIETGWVHTMDMDGYNKWRVIARIKEEKNGVYVFLDKRELVKKIQRTPIGINSEQSQRNRERNTPEASTWRTVGVDKAEIESFHNQLRKKLNN